MTLEEFQDEIAEIMDRAMDGGLSATEIVGTIHLTAQSFSVGYVMDRLAEVDEGYTKQ